MFIYIVEPAQRREEDLQSCTSAPGRSGNLHTSRPMSLRVYSFNKLPRLSPNSMWRAWRGGVYWCQVSEKIRPRPVRSSSI